MNTPYEINPTKYAQPEQATKSKVAPKYFPDEGSASSDWTDESTTSPQDIATTTAITATTIILMVISNK